MSQPPLNSGDWRKVREIIDQRIALHQLSLESSNHDALATAMLRGRIRELRDLIAWGEPRSAPVENLAKLHGY